MVCIFLGVLRKTMHRNARTSAVVDAIQRALNGVKDLEEGRRKIWHYCNVFSTIMFWNVGTDKQLYSFYLIHCFPAKSSLGFYQFF